MRLPFFRVRRLEGAPKVRREKLYTSSGGYVFSYFFLGHRTGRRAIEYVFEASADRSRYSALRVALPDAVLEDWAGAHGRALEATERYAIAKMALQRAFDDCVSPEALRRIVPVTPEFAREILEGLGIE